MRTPRQSGQAAVESIGVTVVVALLLAATAAWVVAGTHPPGSPPDVVGRVAEPLSGPYDSRLWSAPGLPTLLGAPGGHAGAPIGRALRVLGRGAVTGLVVAVEARNEFFVGFGERIRERAGEVLRHPLGEVEDLPDPDLFTLRGVGLLALTRAGELWDYGLFLKTLPPRVAIMTAARDAGRASADVAIQLGQRALRRRLMRGRGTPPPPGAPVSTRAP